VSLKKVESEKMAEDHFQPKPEANKLSFFLCGKKNPEELIPKLV